MRDRAAIFVAGAVLAALLFTAGAAPAAVEDDGKTWGLVARGGAFGVPSLIADELFLRHPEISGIIAGAEVRYFGDGGGRGVASIGLAVDRAEADGDGIWQREAADRPIAATGTVSMTAITLTGYWNILPSWPVHPYFGLGLGAAHFVGEYEDEHGPVEESGWLPVLHVPVGLALELGPNLQLSAEARFIGGFSGGAALQLRF